MKTLNVTLKDAAYSIYIEKGILSKIGIEIKKIYKNKDIVIITDTNVDTLYSSIVIDSLKQEEYNVSKIVLEAGEKSKSVEVLLKVYKELTDLHMSRGSLIISLGGGVIGDLSGFAASTFLRGIPYIQIPTTLLAQVDSSIGGKVAVNLPQGKNLIGSFYHPLAVFIDPTLLETLEDRFFSDGMAEVIKYGAIKNHELFERLLNYNKSELYEFLDEIIYSCCKIKKEIVEIDEKDTGDRMLLNFGHTIGHSIEKYFNYETYTHGEGVAIGMYVISKISEELGLTKKSTSTEIKNILKKYNLPYEMPQVDFDKVINTISLDKKNLDGYMNVILISEIGISFIHKLEHSEIRNFFRLGRC